MRKPIDELKTSTKYLLNKGLNLIMEIISKKNIFKYQTNQIIWIIYLLPEELSQAEEWAALVTSNLCESNKYF